MKLHLPPLLRQRDYALYWVAMLTRMLPTQMIAVAVGWQVYPIHRRRSTSGWSGSPSSCRCRCSRFPAGQLADRLSRRIALGIALGVSLVDAAGCSS